MPGRLIEYALAADAGLAELFVQLQGVAFGAFLQRGDQPAGV